MKNTTAPKAEAQAITVDFSLVRAGPFYGTLQRLFRLRPEHTFQQVVFWVALTWLPLLALSVLQGTAWGSRVRIPLLYDLSAFGRFFVALPLLILAESIIGRFTRHAVSTLNACGIIRDGDLASFRGALTKVARLRDSGIVEVILALLSCIPFYLIFADYEWITNEISSWHGTTSRGLSPAGWWFTCVSSPVLRFLMFCWLWRFALWSYLLSKVSRFDLALVPAHPDRVGGLGFLLFTQQQFGTLAAAMGSVIAGQFGNEIVHFKETFNGIRAPAAVYIAISIVTVLFPLACFSFRLFEARYDSLVRNNRVARSVSNGFDSKWARGLGAPPEAMIGTQDPSSMIDYISTYDVIRETLVIPVKQRAVIYVGALAAAPFASLWLLNKTFDRLIAEILKRLLQ